MQVVVQKNTSQTINQLVILRTADERNRTAGSSSHRPLGFGSRAAFVCHSYVAAPVEFFGGIALILGLATRYVASLLPLFVIIATLSSRRYWEFAEAAPRRAQDSNFYKNLAIMGGLVFAFVTAGGRFSIDRLLARK